ncbi:helix-turn-helix domain-containing protein [Chryseobacterium sp. IT-36CA2]|uniref:helix-turn-helix domain-containing protein n=1 Tax=Chryseobacterium sp. IT-36CA2 TaxID=3026460 RepID=UPI0039DF58E8
MDRKKQKIEQPYYKKIYTDILQIKFPEKIDECQSILSKEKLGVLDIIKLNQKIFGIEEISSENQRLRSYDDETIIQILEYQKKYKLNNTQLSNHYKLSRNTITKWKSCFKI